MLFPVLRLNILSLSSSTRCWCPHKRVNECGR